MRDTAQAMESNRLNLLTLKEREILAHVADLRQSKEIAPLVGLSNLTVDTYIKRIVAKLGAADRKDAARLYREASRAPVPTVGTQPAAIAADPAAEAVIPPPGIGEGSDAALLSSAVRQRLNELSWWQRGVGIMVIAIGAAIAFGGVSAGLQWLGELG